MTVRGIILLFMLMASLTGWAQPPVYSMANQTVTDCQGTLTDSEAGQTAGHYNHNEDLTFTICPPNATRVTLQFTGIFCTEPVFDVLRIFDGPDTNATLIGRFEGSTSPGTVVANSGCMTLHFRSDANRSCDGWTADWTIDVQPPIPPVVTGLTNVSCFSNTFRLQLDQPIPCDSLYPALCTLTGPGNPTISQIAPVNCNNGMTSTFQVTLNPGFSDNGNHNLSFIYRYRDACDSIWTFQIAYPFAINDCPLEVTLVATPDTICQGGCTSIEAIAMGGQAGTYQYTWNPPLPNSAGPHVICPGSTTTYSVTVTDAGPSPAASTTKRVVVTPKPNAGSDRTVCLFSGPINLTGSPAGGWWVGPGIINGGTGTFHPDTAGPGIHQIRYWRNGCADTVQITVDPIFAGNDDAACPGTAPFAVSGGIPGGGTWSGSGIAANGVFNPTTAGTFPVTYTAPNGCSHTKNIHVAALSVPTADTTCTSIDYYAPPVSPMGGRWSGINGIDPLSGEIDPSIIPPGMYTLTYTLNGCSADIDLYIQRIRVPNGWNVCPDEGIVSLPTATPAGGYWSGSGIVDSIQGLFDAGANGGNNFTPSLVYHFGDCTDTMIAYVRQTRIYIDTLFFCQEDSVLLLNWENVRRTPGNGQWSGPGVIDPDWPGRFNPLVAGPGTHTLYYEANTCLDSMVMVVYPVPTTQADTTVCQTSLPFTLSSVYPGGLWSGTGIVNPQSGLFSPQLSGLGDFPIVYTHFIGCTDTMQVTVEPLVNPQLTNPGSYFCYKDTQVTLQAIPTGGIWQGAGVTATFFNPAIAGEGIHTLLYTVGSGPCAVTDSLVIEVGAPIQAIMSAATDTICYGDFSQFAVQASGGTTGIFSYTWNQGLPGTAAQSVNPTTQTTYQVTVTDGCADPALAEIAVFVHPAIVYNTSSSAKVCYGDTGWIAIRPAAGKDYGYQWNTTPSTITDTLFGTGGAYQVTITDNTSGCALTDNLNIPGYAFINARFAISPNTDCIDYLDPVIEVLDNSTGATKGVWDFGDGTQRPYQPGAIIQHTYADTGQYTLTLFLENSGGCRDSASLDICVEPAATLYVPNAFTPNGDGKNEVFKAAGIGIVTFRMMIFNRWGEKLFESNSIDVGWDGRVNGEKVMNDVYTYLIAYQDISSPVMRYKKGVVAVVR